MRDLPVQFAAISFTSGRKLYFHPRRPENDRRVSFWYESGPAAQNRPDLDPTYVKYRIRFHTCTGPLCIFHI